MSKIAFMFPGQGSFDPGMGREIAEAEPAAMAVYEAGSAASGLDLRRLCFAGTHEELMDARGVYHEMVLRQMESAGRDVEQVLR